MAECRIVGLSARPRRFAGGITSFGPRQATSARAWLKVLLSTCTVVFFAATLLDDAGINGVQVVCGIFLGLLCIAVIVLPPAYTAILCIAGPVAGMASVIVLDLGTNDAGLTGQIFFCLPVLYASVHLRVPGAVLITAAAVTAEATVVSRLLPLEQALTDLAYMGGTLILMGSVLTRAMDSQDRLVEKLREQATVDSLTGLVTRRVLDDAVSTVSRNASAVGTALILIDVDNFKTINDTYGHAIGDDALVHLATVLSTQCRPQDVLARMGGDELAVLLPECSHHSAVTRAEDLVQLVHNHPLTLPDGHQLQLSISAGAAHSLQHTAARELYVNADTALYDAKRTGRGRVGHPTRTPP